MEKETGPIVGLDVSKDTLEVAVRPEGDHWVVPNDEQGIGEVVDRLRKIKPVLVVLEATGGLEMAAVAAMAVAKLPVVVVNPRQVRDFAKATGTLAKTDSIDARVVAHFGEAVRPEVRPLKDPQAQELDNLVARRRQLMQMLTAEKNRLTSATSSVRKDIQAHIQWLQRRLEDGNTELKKRIKHSALWREKDEIIQSVPGAGPVLSVTLLADLPELGLLSARKVSALVGVVPFNRDSGRHKGQRRIWGGRANVRAVLYMSTLAATRCNPVIRSHYQRLTKAGKKPKVALTACMRKFLVILNTMVKTGTPWRYDYVP